MGWVLAYLIVGMICVSIMLQPALRKSVKMIQLVQELQIWLSLYSFVFLLHYGQHS
ncbi:hypothetical protein [Bacillus cereus]|uniref:hypothetical protein n=1 Tax=Bacillus cereus TaxID=1396 RepID=UPI0015CF1CCD|nr:hypothetical protein [Bacillus cereus]